MPTTLATPSPNNASMRFKEPYVSDGTNRKGFGPVPSGIIRGGRLVTSGVGLVVNIEPDPNTGDSIYTVRDQARQLTYRDDALRALNLTPLAGATVYIGLFVDYSTSGPTVAEWRAYTEAELFGGAPVPEAGDVVIVGQVVVPLVGPIPVANVTPKNARFAWADESSGMRPWRQIVQNGGFEAGLAPSAASGRTVPFFNFSNLGGAPTIGLTTTNQRSGQRALEWTGSGPADYTRFGPVGYSPQANLQFPLVPVRAGQRVMGAFYVSGATVPVYTQGVGGVVLRAVFFDDAGATIATAVIVETDPAVHVGTFGYELVSGLVAAPADCYVGWQLDARLDLAGGPGSFRLDDFRIFIEAEGERATEEQDSDGVALERSALPTRAVHFLPSGAAAVADKFDDMATLFASLVGGVPHMQLLRADLASIVPWLTGFQIDPLAASSPRLSTSKLADHVLIWESPYAAGPDLKIRLYSRGTGSGDGGFEFTLNARFDTGTSMWVADDVNLFAHRMTYSPSGLTMDHHGDVTFPIPGPWADAAWDQPVAVRLNGLPVIEPRLRSNALSPGQFMLLWEARYSASRYARIYAPQTGNATGGLIFTINARHDGANWVADSTADDALKFELRAGVAFDGARKFGPIGGPWADTAWDHRGFLFNHDEADHPLFFSDKTPGDHPGSPANIWKLITYLPSGDGGRAFRIYVGAGVNTGAFAFTFNAGWVVSSQLWSADAQGATTPSARFMIGRFTAACTAIFQHKENTSAQWADTAWDVGPTTQPFSGALLISDEYGYAFPRARTKYIPSAVAIPEMTAGSPDWILRFSPQNEEWEAFTAASARLFFPIILPSNSILTSIVALVEGPGGTAEVKLRVWKKTLNLGVSTFTQLGATDTTSVGFVGFDALTAVMLEAIVNNGHEYFVEIEADGTVGSKVTWVGMIFADVGLRND